MKKPEKRRFKDTKLGKKIQEKAPEALDSITDIAGEFFPPIKVVKRAVESVLGTLDADLQNELIEYSDQYVEYQKAVLADKNSARERQVKFAQLRKFDFMMLLSGLIGLGSFSFVVYTVFTGNIPAEIRDNPMLHQIAGLIEGVALSIFAYYFGSSKGSRIKDYKQ